MDMQVKFVWIASLVGVVGNELRDKYAKEALNNNYLWIDVGIKQIRKWQEETSGKQYNYHEINPIMVHVKDGEGKVGKKYGSIILPNVLKAKMACWIT